MYYFCKGVIFLKKKKHKKKRIKKPSCQLDRHHILFIKKEWSRNGLGKLRLHPYCVVKIPRDSLHRYIHTHLAYIPTPRPATIQEVLYHLHYLEKAGAITMEDPIEKRLKVLVALFDCVEQPTADALEKQLNLVREFKKGLV